MTNPPTPEQQAILAFAKERTQNLLVNALAGTGKTTTIEMVCKAIQGIPILYLAFNKRIVDEAVKRMPSHVECKTQNALGHRVWGQATGTRLAVDKDKMRNILRGIISELPRNAQGDAWDDFSDTMKWLARAKRVGYVPERWKEHCNPITRDPNDLDDDDTMYPAQLALVNEAMIRSIKAAYAGGIDYDDQIYMPVVFGGPWPKFPLVLVDEAQDLSPLQHRMLEKLVVKRLIAVGDPWQSIYAFRGAVFNGMKMLQRQFNMAELPLSVTFRVPERGVRRAQSRVPHYVAHENNPEGEIVEFNEWSQAEIPAAAAIICRNNAPLLSLGFKLLRAGRGIKLVGFDIGAGLVRILKKLGPESMDAREMDRALHDWYEKQARTSRKLETLADRYECLLALTEGRERLGDAIANAETIFKTAGPIQLMSGHKSKGLEFPWVMHLDPWRVPSEYTKEGTEEYEQELNVRYVIETRFQQTLVLADLGGFHVD
jgi:superfamily I DNA/RNA helicase